MPSYLLLTLSLIPWLTSCGESTTHPHTVGLLEWDRVELVADASEPIVELPLAEGGMAETGQILARLDPARRQARVDQARSASREAAARLRELEAGPRKEQIAQAKARFAGAKLVAEVREREYKRLLDLTRRNAASLDAADQARGNLDAARAERDASAEALRELQAGTRTEQIEQARQALAETEAALRFAETDLERMTLRAPAGGRLDSLPLPLGNRPQAGAVVAVLLAGKGPYARVYIPELLRAQVHSGSAALIRVDGLDGAYPGKVRMVQADPAFTPFYALTERDRKRLSYVAKIDFEGPSDLPAGLPVEVEFPGLDARQ